jgi:hypothetical protein
MRMEQGFYYELPEHIRGEDDRALLHNVLAAMSGAASCKSYKIDVVTTGFVLRGRLDTEVFELDSQDLFLILSISPLKIDRVSVARVAGHTELVVRVLNSRQRIMAERVLTVTATKRHRSKSSSS